MKPLVYFFGTLPYGFSSYPEDHTKAFFEDFLKRSKHQAQIVVHRDGNLLHYGYVRQISANNYWGICLCIDCIFKDTKYLFESFDYVFANLVHHGIILKMGTPGKLEWTTKTFVSESVTLRECTNGLLDLLAISAENTQTLPPVDFSIAINDCIELSIEKASQATINEAIGRYPNIYITKSEAEIERLTSYANVLREKEKEVNSLREEIKQCKQENEEIMRQKKQYRFVAFLSLALIGLGFGLYILTNNLNSTRKVLDDANKQILVQNDSLKSKTGQISTLQTQVQILRSDLRSEKEKFSNLESEIASVAPFIITKVDIGSVFSSGDIDTDFGGTLYQSRVKFLKPKMYYRGFSAGTYAIKTKWFSPDGTLISGDNSPYGYSQSNSCSLSKGKEAVQLGGWGYESPGNWSAGTYKLELWWNDKCLFVKSFKIHS